MRGRPQLFGKHHPLNVLISTEDYKALRERAAVISRDRPGYTVADLVRSFIGRGLGARTPARSGDRQTEVVRRLRGIARSAQQLAGELKISPKAGSASAE